MKNRLERKEFTFRDYQDRTPSTAVYPSDKAIEYLALGLSSEAGEVTSKIKKVIRGDTTLGDIALDIFYELGDVLWYVSELSNHFGFDLDSVARSNLVKLHVRKEKGTLASLSRDETR